MNSGLHNFLLGICGHQQFKLLFFALNVFFVSLLSRFFIFGVQQFDYDILGILFRFYWVSWTCKFILFTKFRVFSNDFVKTFFLWIIFSPSLYKTPMAKTLGLPILSHRFLKLFIFFSWGVCSFLRARISGSDFESFGFFLSYSFYNLPNHSSYFPDEKPILLSTVFGHRNPAASSGVTPRSYSMWNLSIQLELTIILSLSFSSPFLVSHIKKDPKTLKSKT